MIMNLPLTNNPEESFNISIFEMIYLFRQLWNENGFWTFDINDSNGNIIVYGVKVITKEFLLQQYPQLRFDLISEADSDPGRNNLDSFNLKVINKDV